jgi:hypothetical protein
MLSLEDQVNIMIDRESELLEVLPPAEDTNNDKGKQNT